MMYPTYKWFLINIKYFFLSSATQNMSGIRIKAIGWDGYSRGSYFDNATYYIP